MKIVNCCGVSTVTALASALGGQAASLAPASLAQIVIKGAVMKAGASVGGTIFLSTIIGTMNTTKFAMAAIVLASAVTVGTLMYQAEDTESASLIDQTRLEKDGLIHGGGSVDAIEGVDEASANPLDEEGRYEFTFFTPEVIELEDGLKGIKASIRIISGGTDFTADSGLDTLATNARNTIQHAEAWRSEDAESILKLARGYQSTRHMSAPSTISGIGQEFALAIGSGNGSTYQLAATVDQNETGDFVIDSRIERPDILSKEE